MKIALMLPVMPPAFSGAGKRGWRLARALAARGADVIVLTYTRGAEAHRVPGVHVRVLPSWNGLDKSSTPRVLRKPAALAATFAAYRQAFAILRDSRPDVLFQVGMGLSPQIVGAASMRLRIPTIANATLEGSDDPVAIGRHWMGRLLVPHLKRYSAIVSNSPRIHRLGLQVGLDPGKCVIIPNDVDTDRFHAVSDAERTTLRDSLGLPSAGPVLVTIGRISARKATLELVEAFSTYVLKRFPSATLVVVGPTERQYGSGSYTGAVIELMESRRASGAVRLVGEVSDTAPWLQSADAFVFASRSEGFPTSVAEAAAVGLPVAVRHLDGITSFILADVPEPEIFDRDDALGPAMVGMLQRNRGELQRASAGEAGVKRFSATVVHDAYLDLFCRVARSCHP